MHAAVVTVAAAWLLTSEELSETLVDWSGGGASAAGTHPVLRATPAGHVLLGVSFGCARHRLFCELRSQSC